MSDRNKIALVKKAIILEGTIFSLLGAFTLLRAETVENFMGLDAETSKWLGLALLITGCTSVFVIPLVLKSKK